MRKYKLIMILLLTIATFGAYGQSEVKKLAVDFKLYAQNALPEKLFLHTDKNAYAAGEIIWFRIYDVDGMTNKPLGISKVAYIEILDKSQNAVLQTKVGLSNGLGKGSVYLPVAFNTGNYILRAYTSWMKNFSADSYFQKQLTVINPLKSPSFAGKPAERNIDVQFFPEGGKLVAGITSEVGFKGVDQLGRPATFRGAVLNEHNDTVARFSTFKYGMGHFTFKPQAGISYHAVIMATGKHFNAPLPEINNVGYVMKLTDDGGDNIQVTLKTNLPATPVYLLAQTQNTLSSVQTGTLNGTAQFVINKNELDEGVTRITLFDAQRNPVCERLWFKKPSRQLNINANTNAAIYNQRERINLTANVNNGTGQASVVNLSVSVYQVDSLQHDDQEHILSYLWLRSELKGTIFNPDHYFDDNNPNAAAELNDLLLTQGWRTFDWDALKNTVTPAFNFLPEYNGPIITGRVTDKATGKPAPGVQAYLGVVGKSVQLSTAQSNDTGLVVFNMHNFYGPAEIVAETNTVNDTSHHIDIVSPFSDKHSAFTVPDFYATPNLQSAFGDRSLSAQVQNAYSYNKLWQFNDMHADSSAFYGQMAKVYLLDNYTRFVTTEEVMREFIREVNVVHGRDGFHIKVLNGLIFLPEGDPMVLVDGIPFFDMNKVFAVDPLKIRKIEAVPYRYKLGPTSENGIFSFTSYKGDLAGASIDPHAVILDYEGLQKERKFYSPVYETAQDAATRMPDMRNVLYWQPDAQTDKTGKVNFSFFSSDEPGKYIAVIQALSNDGSAGSKTISFEVK